MQWPGDWFYVFLFTERFMAARHQKGYCRQKKLPIYFLGCKGRSIDDVGVSRDTAFQEIRPGAGFETGDFVKKKFFGGGYRRTTPGSPALK